MLSGCSFKSPLELLKSSKPNNHYYSSILTEWIINEKNYEAVVFQINMQKEKNFPSEGKSNLTNFFKSLKQSYFIEKPEDLPKNPQYKIFIVYEGEKYIINIFNDKYLSIHPWDGNYSEDYIDMSRTSKLYNLYDLCNYFYK